MVTEARALTADTMRVEPDITRTGAVPERALFDQAGIKTVLTIRNHPQPTVYPPHTPDELATFRANLARTLDADKPFLIAVDPIEIAEPAPDLAELDETDGRMGSAHTHELLARAHHLLFGLGAIALTLQGPRPVHTTQSGEDGERVPFRPSARWRRSTRGRVGDRRVPRMR